jgi:hypothetical protein
LLFIFIVIVTLLYQNLALELRLTRNVIAAHIADSPYTVMQGVPSDVIIPIR